MIYISDTSRIISVPKTRDLTGDLSLRLTNIMSGKTTVLSVVDSSTNPYVYKIVLLLSQVRRLEYGEYVYELLVGETIAGQGLLRKPKVYDADTAYTNIVPNIVYGENSETVIRYRVVISASVGCSIIVNGQNYDNFDQFVREGTILVVTANPEEHYSFTSWSDGVEDQTRTIIVENDVNLYASVEAETFTVAISSGDHGSVSVNGVVGDYFNTLPYGTQLTLIANADTGYEFYQWSDGNTNATRTITVTDNISLTSAFETEVYNIVITADAHCSITVNGVPGNYSGRLPYHSVVTVIATPDTGYNFTGWSDGDGASSRSILIEGDLTLTTSTQIQSFMVNIMTSDNQEGAVVVNGTPGDYITQVNYGTVLTLTTQPTTGYEFLMWSDGVIADQRTITVTDNVTLRATFAVQTFTVTVTPGAHSTVFVNGHQYSVQYYEENVPYGRNYVIEGRPDTGYSWVGWDDGSTTNPRVIHGINADINLTCEVQVSKYWVRIEAGANGTISVDGVSYNNRFFQQINYGTTIQINGVADNGYDFDQWSDGDNTNPRTITVTGPVTLTASFEEHFEQSTRQIVYTSVSGQTITPSANAYDANDNALTIVSNDYSRGFGVITYSDVIYKLGSDMFKNDTDLNTVTIPDGVYKIDTGCFYGCSNLTGVKFGENSILNTIESESFAYTALTSFTFPATIENVFWYVFNGVSTLSDIYVPRFTNFSGNNGSTFVYFNSYNGTLHTSYYNTFNYTYNEYWQNRLVNDYGWTVEYFEQFIDVSFGGMCSQYSGNTLQAYDANNNQLTVTSQYYSCGHTVYTFSGDVYKVDYLHDANAGSYNDYVQVVVMKLPHLTEVGDHMFSGFDNLSRIDIYNTTAPTVHSNTFKNVAINGTLNYPSGANYSSWLSVSDYYLGWYNWNDALSAHNVVYVKSNNINLTIDDQYLRDANDNQVSIQSHAFDGQYHKFVMNGQFSKITDGTANAGWIDPIYRSSVERIKFSYEPNITVIGDYQWSGFSNISEVTGLFANVQTIGNYGFMGSSDAYDHTGFQSLTSIGVGAFKNARMQSTTVSGSFTSIPDEAFLWDGDAYWQTNSFTVKSTAAITYIGHNVFGGLGDDNPWRLALLPASGCVVESDAVKTTGITNYGKATIAHSFTDLDTQFGNTNATVTYFDELIYTTNNSQAANGQYYTNVYDSVSNIGDVIYDGGNSDQFANCTNLVTVSIYGRTGYGQFRGCTNLVDADFTDCTYIGSECFDGTSLANIYIPATLTSIGERPFRCDFTTLVVDSNNTAFADGGCNALIKLDNGNYGNIVTISKYNQPPAGIKGFEGWFASGTNRSMALVVPASATEGFAECCWFEGCNLSSFIYDGDPSSWGGNIITDRGFNHWVYQQYLNDCQTRWPGETWYVRPAANQIAYITNDRTAITPDISTHSQDSNGNQLVVASNTYTNQGLLTFTEDVYKLSYFTSADRSKLTAVVLPDGVNEIHFDAFEGASINSLVVPGTVSTLYLQCVRNTNVESLCVPDSVVNAITNSVHGYYGKNIYFGSGLRYNSINNTFNGSILNGPNLESVDISYNNPYYYTIPGSNALFRVSDDVMVAGGICTTIPEGVTELAADTYFGGCLTTVTIPSTVTTIGNYCFGNCTHLAEIICLATTAPTIGTSVFNFTQSGVLKVPTGSNYSAWLSALPSGWVIQYI